MMERMRDIDWAVVIAIVLSVIVAISLVVWIVYSVRNGMATSQDTQSVLNATTLYNSVRTIVGQ